MEILRPRFIPSAATPRVAPASWGDSDRWNRVILSTATPLRGAYLWYDGALTLVILSERVRE